MNCSGEEQERLLSLLEQDARKKNTSRFFKDQRNGELVHFSFGTRTFCDRLADMTHLFTVNPAFTAQDCFQRIDRRLRAALRRKRVPMVSVGCL